MANGNAVDAHYGCVLGHLMNNSYRLGKKVPFNARAGGFSDHSDASEHFLKFRNITNILRQVSYTGTIALGMTFVIVAAGIDLSVGSMVALVGVLAIYLMNYLGTSAFAVVAAVFVAILVGFGKYSLTLLAMRLNSLIQERFWFLLPQER